MYFRSIGLYSIVYFYTIVRCVLSVLVFFGWFLFNFYVCDVILKCTACNDLYDNKSHGTLNVNGSITWDKDFMKKYEAKSYENETCLACKYLPICMGVCPRDYGKPYCKLDRADYQIEDILVDYIEANTKKRV